MREESKRSRLKRRRASLDADTPLSELHTKEKPMRETRLLGLVSPSAAATARSGSSSTGGARGRSGRSSGLPSLDEASVPAKLPAPANNDESLEA